MLAATPLAKWLGSRFGHRTACLVGAACLAGSLTGLSWGVDHGYIAIAALMVVMTVGLRTVMTICAVALVDAMPSNRTSIGAALNDAAQEVGTSVGTAVVGTMIAVLGTTTLPVGTWNDALVASFFHSERITYAVLAIILGLIAGGGTPPDQLPRHRGTRLRSPIQDGCGLARFHFWADHTLVESLLPQQRFGPVPPLTTRSFKDWELMIFITVKWRVRPEYADTWLDEVADFTAATRSERGNLFFEWSRSVADPNTFILLEAFQDDAAGPHVQSEHFQSAMSTFGSKLRERPEVINFQIPGEEWSRLGEVQMDD